MIIVGAGPVGIACAISARRRGLDPLVIDAGAVVHAITRYPVGMTFFTTPELLEIGGHPFTCAAAKPTREEALKYYRGVVRNENLRVRTYCRLRDAGREGDGFACTVEQDGHAATLRGRKLVLATGYFDHPNLLGVPGEDLPHVSHYFDEAHGQFRRNVVVVGGKNSAAEAALDLFRCGARVTLVYRGETFPRGVKYWVRPDLENRIAAGEISARLGATVESIDEESVHVRTADGVLEPIPADRVYALTGYHPDHDLLRRLGIELQGETLRPVHDPETLETNVPGVHLAGSTVGGTKISEIFIENGRFDGEKIFGTIGDRTA